MIGVGTRLGAYEITAMLGKGGMGEVYRASDTRLKRDVAIKLLPDDFSGDSERLGRFQREAEVLASLNHTNIASIYDLAHVNDTRFLVLELVEGETLADRIAKGPISISDCIVIASQICEALKAAHDKGIVHRDLKPANIKLIPENNVKVLDFGLAKVFQESAAPDLTNSPTLVGQSLPGVIMGTAAYMSPEQARGHEVDRRSDIWSFGAVFFEMLAGKPAFDGESVTDILGRIVTVDPDWSILPAATPAGIRKLLRRCLQKERKLRWQDIGDVAIEISQLDAQDQPIPSTRSKNNSAWYASLGLNLLLIATVLGLLLVGYASRSATPTVFERAISLTIEPPSGTRFGYGPDGGFAISPDGQNLLFSAVTDEGQSQLWLRRFDELDARPIPGTAKATSAFFSPDSRSIAFIVDRQLRVLNLAGGLPTAILDTDQPYLRGAQWTSRGTILLGAWKRNVVSVGEIPAGGGEVRLVTTPVPADGDSTHRFPMLLPDGLHLLYLVRGRPGTHGIFVSEPGKPNRRLIARALTSFAFLDPGWLLYGDAGRLLALHFDAAKAEPTAEPQVLLPSVSHQAGSATTDFSASVRSLAFRRGSRATRIDRFAPDGTFRNTIVPSGDIEGRFDLSADGRSIAYAVVDPDTGGRGVWVADLERHTQRRLTPPSVNAWLPKWSPDMLRLAANTGNDTTIFSLDGQAEPEVINVVDGPTGATAVNTVPLSWTTDGQLVLEQEIAGRQRDLLLYDLKTRRAKAIVATPADERGGALSPQGNLLAYISDESGRTEIYIRSLAGTTAPFVLSTRGGTKPVWARDGKEVYYMSPSGAIMAVPVQHSTGVPPSRMLLQTDTAAYFAVSRDGDIIVEYSPDAILYPNISVIINWQRLLDVPTINQQKK